jgi:hypothetical protein
MVRQVPAIKHVQCNSHTTSGHELSVVDARLHNDLRHASATARAGPYHVVQAGTSAPRVQGQVLQVVTRTAATFAG